MKMTRRRVAALAVLVSVAGASGLLLPAYFGHPKARVNRGSCLLACSKAIELIKEYAITNKVLPYDRANESNALMKLGLHKELASLVTYVNDTAIKPDSAARTIVVKCVRSTEFPDGQKGSHVALLSGE